MTQVTESKTREMAKKLGRKNTLVNKAYWAREAAEGQASMRAMTDEHCRLHLSSEEFAEYQELVKELNEMESSNNKETKVDKLSKRLQDMVDAKEVMGFTGYYMVGGEVRTSVRYFGLVTGAQMQRAVNLAEDNTNVSGSNNWVRERMGLSGNDREVAIGVEPNIVYVMIDGSVGKERKRKGEVIAAYDMTSKDGVKIEVKELDKELQEKLEAEKAKEDENDRKFMQVYNQERAVKDIAKTTEEVHSNIERMRDGLQRLSDDLKKYDRLSSSEITYLGREVSDLACLATKLDCLKAKRSEHRVFDCFATDEELQAMRDKRRGETEESK